MNVITNAEDVERIATLFDADRRAQLLVALRQLAAMGDAEYAHGLADRALLDYIEDPEVTAAFDAIVKWYA